MLLGPFLEIHNVPKAMKGPQKPYPDKTCQMRRNPKLLSSSILKIHLTLTSVNASVRRSVSALAIKTENPKRPMTRELMRAHAEGGILL